MIKLSLFSGGLPELLSGGLLVTSSLKLSLFSGGLPELLSGGLLVTSSQFRKHLDNNSDKTFFSGAFGMTL